MNRIANFRLIVILFSYLSIANPVQAIEDTFYINKLNHCKITKSAINDFEPNKFESTNNLLRSTGEVPLYCGKKVIIRGRLLDQNCVPVSDAKIYLWQVGCDGKYPYLPMRDNLDKKLFNIGNGSSFTGSGIATTNNLGEFLFITVRPPSVGKQSPYVNIRAEHMNLGKLQTKLILSDLHVDDLQDDLDDILETLLNDVEVYNYDIVIRGETTSRY